MAIQTPVNGRNHLHNNNNNAADDDDEEIDETEEDLIENYLYLTQRCGVLRHSPTTGAIATLQRQQNIDQSILPRQYSWATKDHHSEFESKIPTSKTRSSLNDFNNNNYQPDSSIISRVPPTIYYNENDDDDSSFSLVKLFARMKGRIKHDRRYRPKSTHELLHEEESQEWFELSKNIRAVLTKALLPDGGYDALIRKSQASYHRKNSQKKSRDYDPVLAKIDDEDKIQFEIDDEFNTENDEEYDEIIYKKFLKCLRGSNYRRCGVCKAVDRQQYQGQLVYVYGVANNILIDENLKASGLG